MSIPQASAHKPKWHPTGDAELEPLLPMVSLHAAAQGTALQSPQLPAPPQIPHTETCRLLPSTAPTVNPKGQDKNWIQPHSAFPCTLRISAGSIRLKEMRYISHLFTPSSTSSFYSPQHRDLPHSKEVCGFPYNA